MNPIQSVLKLAVPLAFACAAWPGIAQTQSASAATQSPASGQLSTQFSNAAGGRRSYFVSLPENYRSDGSYRLVVVFAGTDTTGGEMQDWFGNGWLPPKVVGLERLMKDTIFIYPDQRYSWDYDGERLKGWRMGPYASPYQGNADIQFTRELLDLAAANYAVDKQRVFATGHSWGGDMAAVVGCFLGDRFKAVAPVAANTPFWFGTPNDPSICKGDPSVWTFFGLADEHFGDSSPDGLFGIRQNDFWRQRQGCSAEYVVPAGLPETRQYKGGGCKARLTLYAGGQYSGGGDMPGHSPPDYFLPAVSEWFLGF
ncbi:alpha/beta hydrolase family esterase [Pseudomonas sp. CGJS7]|uniref:alpha/beta hydrolase family esterase n=1 Tax=Pseudomonas sp. CGJS7 TaxID=3109348 RepID=UPI0030093349